MSRRTLAATVSLGLAIVLSLGLVFVTVPYVTVRPGPTLDVLGTFEEEPIVVIDGVKSYKTSGELRLVTVYVSQPDRRVTLYEALAGWVRPSVDVIPYEVEYPTRISDAANRAESAGQMLSAQSNAVAAALRALDYDVAEFVQITSVDPEGPSKKILKARDRFVQINGEPIDDFTAIAEVMGAVAPGDQVTGVVLRDGDQKAFSVKTVKASDNPGQARLGITIGNGFDTPFKVDVDVGDRIGGPSAGLIFSLGVYDTLTPGALLDGATVAGTGTIAATGEVGPIGGIRQKIVAARDAGAAVFLVPPANCAEALTASVDPADIRLVRADTLSSTVEALETFAQDADAALPQCTDDEVKTALP